MFRPFIWNIIRLSHKNFQKRDLHVHKIVFVFSVISQLQLLISLFVSFGSYYVKVKVIPRQTEVSLGVPGRLRPRIISTFGTTRGVGRQPYAPAAFTTVEIPGTHFQKLSRPQGTWFCRKEPRGKKNPH
jgi:hypothetical protein